MKTLKETANAIATSSPVAVQGTKVSKPLKKWCLVEYVIQIVLNYARDHSVDESLRYVVWDRSKIWIISY